MAFVSCSFHRYTCQCFANTIQHLNYISATSGIIITLKCILHKTTPETFVG